MSAAVTPAAPPAAAPLAPARRSQPGAIWLREMRQSARLARTPWVLFGLTLGISLLMCTIGGVAASSETTPAAVGQALFQVFFSLAYMVVVIVGPALAANAVASEREGRTWEAIQLTGLLPRDVARGKFLAAYTTIALYVVVLAPVGALSFLFGGVTATEVVVAFAVLFLLAGLAVAFGLAVSSLMSSQRGAILVTIILAIAAGPLLYVVGGFWTSIGVHELWNEVPEAFPVWLPLAYSRAPFGLEYVLLLFGLPLLLVACPAWFLYEATVANMSADGDDRSTGLKRWFFFCTPLVAVGCTAPSAIADSDDARIALGITGLCFLSAHAGFCALLFASEPPGPSRRVRVHWDREEAGFLRRFFGPGLPKTAVLVAALGFACLWIATAVDAALVRFFTSTTKLDVQVRQLSVMALYASCFFVFATGLAAWLRSRGQAPWVARMIAVAVLFLVSAGPWIVAAIGGAMARHGDDWIIIGAPSPFYAFYMVSWLDSSHTGPVQPVIEAGAICAAGWGTAGIALLVAATLRCRRALQQRDAAFAAARAGAIADPVPALAPVPPPPPAGPPAQP
jgi:ABC-type transport system involved in multi-copper enzyme maturation permease subunit